MKAISLSLVLALLSTAPVFAAKSPGKPAGKPSTPAPSAQLRHEIDTTLPKITNISNPKQKPIDRTKLIELQADYTAKAQVAPPAQQPMYHAALVVVTNLVGAVEEHEKAVADYRYSNNVHGKQDREDAKVSNWQRGPDAGGAARADNAKQNMENAASRAALLQKEKFMNQGAIATWTQRVSQIHDLVEQSYVTELVAEKQMAMSTPPAPPPPPPPAPPTSTGASASQAYSPAGTWTGPNGKWTLTDDGNFTNPTGRKGTWQWADRTKRELGLQWQKPLGDGKAVFSADGKSLEITLPKGGQVSLTR
ncbi:MAG: hypothetical protein P4L99_29105 [Chthoniobacter sp.]|nr:hypothetical protein [Chthoniobacter sp.]